MKSGFSSAWEAKLEIMEEPASGDSFESQIALFKSSAKGEAGARA